ncbi:MAG TPA: helix-turn-helix transcriptional regulator [Verrucomicrobiota bacterium]|nr:helix-turn-helix transcriptional regulator [Verrucomicrobiota bacterium]
MRRLRSAREKSGISMNMLAAEAGLSQSMISRLENHEGNPTLDSLIRITDVLEIDLGKLISEAVSVVGK